MLHSHAEGNRLVLSVKQRYADLHGVNCAKRLVTRTYQVIVRLPLIPGKMQPAQLRQARLRKPQFMHGFE